MARLAAEQQPEPQRVTLQVETQKTTRLAARIVFQTDMTRDVP
jgi:hypothetical protein